MSTNFTIQNQWGQLSLSIEFDLTPEEMIELMWIISVTLNQLNISDVKLHLEMLRTHPGFSRPDIGVKPTHSL